MWLIESDHCLDRWMTIGPEGRLALLKYLTPRSGGTELTHLCSDSPVAGLSAKAVLVDPPHVPGL